MRRRRFLPPCLMVQGVDGGDDDNLIDVMTPLQRG
jgi:hypothetical protein